MGSDFVEALSRNNLDDLKVAPKADLHCHSFFSTRIEQVEAWAGCPLARAPSKMKGLHGMMVYVSEILYPHINSREGFEFTARSSISAEIEDGVQLLEMSFGNRAVKFYPNHATGLAAFVDSLVTEYQDRVELRPELGIMREEGKDPEALDIAREAIRSGPFKSIDLYSHQEACAPEDVKSLFAEARSAGMKLKAHVGEFGDAEEVRRTVEILELDEVQHGIGASESAEVMKWLRDNRVRLHVCPTSNVMLDSVSTLSDHPIRMLYDHGVQVTINSDDLMIFGQSVSEEYLSLYKAGLFSADELDEIRKASLGEGISK